MFLLNKSHIIYQCFFVLSLANFFLNSCADRSGWATKVHWEEFDLTELPSKEEFPDEGAIVLLDEGHMEIFGDMVKGFSTFERHKIIKVLNIRGHRYANIVIPYYPDVWVENIKARTITPEGEIVVLQKNDIFDVNLYPSFVFYSDQRAKIFTMPAVEDGAIIEYKYYINFGKRTLWHTWLFQDDIPTLLSKFTLIHPSEWKINYRAYNIDKEPDIISTPSGFKSTYTWKLRDIPALKFEFAMPNRKELLSRLVFSPRGMATWNDVAQWYHEIISPQLKVNTEIKELARELTAHLNTDEDKLKKIYEWVRDNIRYIAVEIGIGGYQPHPATEVLSNYYGDCKDMTTLLCTLAKEADIEVYEVLISTQPNGIADTSLPSPYHFNHAIAFSPTVGENGTWMDATEKGCPFSKLPWYDQGVNVLIVKKDALADVRKTPILLADSNRIETDWWMDLGLHPISKIEGRTRYRGTIAAEIREELFYASEDEIESWLELFLAKRCSGVKLEHYQILGLTPVVDPLEITYSFEAEDFMIIRENKHIIRPGESVMFELPAYFRSKEREFPIQFQYGFLEDFDLYMRLSPNLKLNTEPFQKEVNSPFGFGYWALKLQNNMIHFRIKYQISSERISPANYTDFQKFLDDVSKFDLKELVLTQK